MDHEPVRTPGFSAPQGRPEAGAGSCGLKSALRGRFMESDLFLLDLLRGHEPKGAAKADALQTLRAAPRHVRSREAPGVRGFIADFRDRFMERGILLPGFEQADSR